jgi:hypothetical protein
MEWKALVAKPVHCFYMYFSFPLSNLNEANCQNQFSTWRFLKWHVSLSDRCLAGSESHVLCVIQLLCSSEQTFVKDMSGEPWSCARVSSFKSLTTLSELRLHSFQWLDDEGYWNGNDVKGSQQQGLRDEIVGDVTNPLTSPKLLGVSPCLRMLTRGLIGGNEWKFCNHENVRYIGQGEAQHRKYKKLKLGGGHVYDSSSLDCRGSVSY